MKRHRLTTVLAAAAMGLSLVLALATACASGVPDGSIKELSFTPIDGETLIVTSVGGEAVSVGNVSAICPEGWHLIPRIDYFSDEPDATDPNHLYLAKGSNDGYASVPFVSLMYYGEGYDFGMTIGEEKSYFVESIGGLTDVAFELDGEVWEGFIFPIGATDEEYYLRNRGNDVCALGIRSKSDSGEIALTDDDVLTIIASLQY